MCDATPAAYTSKVADCCKLLVMEEMKALCLNKEKDKLYELMQSQNWQAFYDIDYGGLPGGVFTAACPPEALHSLENGLVLHCLKELFESVLNVQAKASLDHLVQKWIEFPKQNCMKSYMAKFPRMLYKDGLTTISERSRCTKMGILFSFVIAGPSAQGYRLLHKQAQIAAKYGDIIHVFEMLLCYWAWLKKDKY